MDKIDWQPRIDAAMANEAMAEFLDYVPFNDPAHCSSEEELHARCMRQLSEMAAPGSRIIRHDFRREN